MKIKQDPRPLAVRLWVFQRERAPLYGVALMATATVGTAYQFSDLSWRYYFIAAAIIALYLLQIRTADERKDFEHDNKFHPKRPVQRGVVSLKELAIANKITILGQLILYASFMNMRIFLLGLLSQGYAQLTSKEFFIREWIRQHFFIYYISHYAQLVILFYAMINIVSPQGESYWSLITLYMLCVIATELGRKMLSVKDDTTDDTYSAQLGHRGSAITVTLIAVGITYVAHNIINRHAGNNIYMIAPVIVLGLVAITAYRYAASPNRKNSSNIEKTSALMYITAMLTVIAAA